MYKFELETSETPTIIIEKVDGDLILKGQNRAQILVKASEEEGVEFQEDGEQVSLRCPADCTIYIPHRAAVQLNKVGGDASIKALDGQVECGKVGGDLLLRDVGVLQVTEIGGDLSAKRVRGDLVIGRVGGTVIVRDVDGQFSGREIGGHLNLRDVSGGVVATAGGNVEVLLSPVPWQTYAIQAGGNIFCRLSEESSAEVHMISGANNIRLALPEISKRISEGQYTATIGENGPQINLQAGASVELRSRTSGWETFGEVDIDLESAQLEDLTTEIENQVNQQLEGITEQLDSYLSQLAGGLDADLSPEKRQRIQDKIHRAQERSQRANERAREKLHRKLEAAQRKLEQRSQERIHPVRPPRPPAPPSPAKRFVWPMQEETQAESAEEVSDEERLLILKMLEQNQISTAEAEQLLSALEGGEA